jgi:hypothetical protein
MKTRRATELTVPLLSVTIGVVYLVVGLIGGQTTFALVGLGIMLALAVVLWLVRGRSETVKGLLDRRDERINAIDLTATAYTAGVLILALLVAFVVSVARGDSGAPYYWLLALAGITYLVALVVLRLRG